MDCKEFRERLDLYLDGELSSAEADESREHTRGCASCAKAEARLRGLRGSLKRAVNRHEPPPGLKPEVLRSLRAPSARTHGPGHEAPVESTRAKTTVWRAKVNVPVPLLALLVLCLVALVVWLAFARGPAREEISAGRPAPAVSPAPAEGAPGGFDFSRYYGGGRAGIQVVRRASLEGAGR